MLVEPPMAMSSVIAFSNAAKFAMERGSTRVVVLLVVAAREIDDEMAGLDEQPLAVGVGRERRAVAGQRQAQRLGQAVHRVGGEHARARAAGRAGRALDRRDVGVGDLLVGGGDHGVDQVERLASCRRSTTLPASIGPPETNTAGMLRRSAAISMPGVILSQLEMQTMASAQWALTMYSTLSAMISREGSE